MALPVDNLFGISHVQPSILSVPSGMRSLHLRQRYTLNQVAGAIVTRAPQSSPPPVTKTIAIGSSRLPNAAFVPAPAPGHWPNTGKRCP